MLSVPVCTSTPSTVLWENSRWCSWQTYTHWALWARSKTDEERAETFVGVKNSVGDNEVHRITHLRLYEFVDLGSSFYTPCFLGLIWHQRPPAKLRGQDGQLYLLSFMTSARLRRVPIVCPPRWWTINSDRYIVLSMFRARLSTMANPRVTLSKRFSQWVPARNLLSGLEDTMYPTTLTIYEYQYREW